MDAIASFFTSGKYAAATILLAYFLLQWLSQHITWLQQGKRAAAVAGIIGGFAPLVAQVAASGSLPDVKALVGAVGAAVLLFIHPTVQPKAAA